MASKLGIIGVGHVGATVLTEAVNSHLFSEIVTIDSREKISYGEALDNAHATGLMSRSNVVVRSGNYSDLSDAEVIIVAATHVYPEGEIPAERQELLKNNAKIVRQIMTDITSQTRAAILIFITNPADTVVHIAASEFNYPKNRVIGTGCMLDSARLRYVLSQTYGIDPKSISGFMLAEHGMTAFPALSHLTIGSLSYEEFAACYPAIEPFTPQDLKDQVVQAAYEVFYAKNGVTSVAIAKAAIDLARAVVLNEKSIFPVSSLLDEGQYGTRQSIALSTPCVVGRDGIEKVFEVNLNEWERLQMAESIRCISQSIELAGKLKQE